jgi:hypothetical protein
LNVIALGEAAFSLPLLEHFCALVFPSAFPHKLLPDVDLLRTWFLTGGEAPLESSLIVGTFDDFPGEGVLGDVEKVYAPFVETASEVLMQLGMELFGVFEPNLVEHAPKIDNAADFLMGTARIGHQGNDG